MENALVVTRLRGRNGAAPPMDLPDDLAIEARDVEFYRASLARKRAGASLEAIGAVFTSPIGALARHVPGQDQTAAELWAVGGTTVGRMAGASTFSSVTLKDAATGSAWDHRFATLNGKLFHAYDSAVDRLHVWDGTEHRRVGLAAPAAPSAADTGAGAYAAVKRYYRVRYLIKSGSVIVARSEPSPSMSFTPSGTGAAVRVTKPAAISESETHWELEASADGNTFYLIATTAVGTTTYDDSADVTTYADHDASALVGSYEPPKSVRYLLAMQNYLLLAGAWETGNPRSRVYWIGPLGETNEGDDERVVNTSDRKQYTDLAEGAGGDITGLGGPLMGNVVVFKESQIWKLVPTGDPTAAFRRFMVTDRVGAIRHEAIVTAVDEDGDPALYFLDRRKGPYRLGKRGLQWIGADIEDVWATFSPNAANVACWGLYYPDKSQVLFGVATGTDDPDEILVFDTRLGRMDQSGGFSGGWSRWMGGLIPRSRAAVLFADSRGATMSLTLKPHYADSAAANTLYKGDTGTDDAGTAFQSYVETRAMPLAAGAKAGCFDPLVVAEAGAATIEATVNADFGRIVATATASLAATGSETHVVRAFGGLALSDVRWISVRLGDAAAQAAAWVLNTLIVPLLARAGLYGHG